MSHRRNRRPRTDAEPLSVKDWIARAPGKSVTREEVWNLLDTAIGVLRKEINSLKAQVLPDLTPAVDVPPPRPAIARDVLPDQPHPGDGP